ncbi:MAG: NUDIX domain-containing protein, partial [Actinomycetota bacterium]
MSFTLVVAAAIVDDLEHPQRLLAARRSAPPAMAGLWEFPGGKVEPG